MTCLFLTSYLFVTFHRIWIQNGLNQTSCQCVRLLNFLLSVVDLMHRIENLFSFIFRAMIMVRENHPSSYGSGYGYAIALFFVVLSQTLLHQLYQHNNVLTAVKVKTAVVGLIYKKVIKYSSTFLSKQKLK